MREDSDNLYCCRRSGRKIYFGVFVPEKQQDISTYLIKAIKNEFWKMTKKSYDTLIKIVFSNKTADNQQGN